MKPPRPYRRAQPDKNHSIIPKALKTWGGGFSRDEYGVWSGHIHGLPVAAYDVSKLGGEFPDWLVSISWMVIGLEVKQARPPDRDERTHKQGRNRAMTDSEYRWSQLKPGEKAYFNHTPMLRWIVATEEEVWVKIMDVVRFVECIDGLPLAGEFMGLFFPKTREENQEEQFDGIFELITE